MKKKTKIIIALCLALVFAPAGALAAGWKYAALGDSLAYGTGATGNQGYANLYEARLESDNGISAELSNLGVPGWTSSDLLSALRTDSAFQTAVAESDVTTIDIGGNDLLRAVAFYKLGICGGKKNNQCLKSAYKKLKSNWKKIFSRVRKLRGGKAAIIRTMNLYYSSVSMDMSHDSFSGDKYKSDFAFFNPYLLKANKYLKKSASKKKILTADVHLLFNGASGVEDPQGKGYISIDGLHPSDAGYQVMADALRSLGYQASK